MNKNNPISDYLVSLSKKYNIKLSRSEYCNNNTAISAGTDEIMLGNFDNKNIEIVAFFHELAHCRFAKDMTNIFSLKDLPAYLSVLSKEGLCWEYGLYLAKVNGYEFNDDMRKYAYSQYLTYLGNDADMVKFGTQYHKELNKLFNKLNLPKLINKKTLKEFIELYIGHNSIIKLWKQTKRGHELIIGKTDGKLELSCMEWQILKGKVWQSQYLNNYVLYIMGTITTSDESDSINIVLDMNNKRYA